MTLEELKNSRAAFVTCQDVGPIIQVDPHTLHMQALDEKWKAKLGFPVNVFGNRVRIPRIPFLKYIGEDSDAAVDG